ncbi:ankyrin, putative [Talaromyces stipitatus ATCC 10500]|uniref:Ankyrin, putative n=1 Tax=Talaromyces stipitatus (strain ATCC 10500 / CBS 375.48 / QM 6759 / NRRL 1006) TaxID=441959 RepID=B8MC64_TALSN|nr:ankyrin, putative [Talaromyces stipitatus ATCC 10500]EED18510.1 ankyrin, putative [Talaromyces stipitatus ATCC 10500]
MDGVNPDSKDRDGWTPLFYAASEGHETIVKLLLNMDGVDPNSRTDNGLTPLSMAAYKGHEAVVKLLLNIDTVDPDLKDNNGWTPLSRAASRGHKAIVKLLLNTDRVDPDSKDNNGWTPLFYAASKGHEAIVKLLLNTDGVDPDPKDDGSTPLFYAASKGHEAIVKLLLNTDRVDPDLKNNDGRTPLSIAAYKGHEATVKLLLNTGRVDQDLKDNDGQTPLSRAASEGHEAIVKLLLNTDGETPSTVSEEREESVSCYSEGANYCIEPDNIRNENFSMGLQEMSINDTSTIPEDGVEEFEKIHLIEYLFKRLHQLGARSVYGVSKDYNLTALDYVQPCDLRWVGNANELNAGYAADDARIKGISALMTVMGVGELSAMNTIAGAFTEKVPSCILLQLQLNLHHSLGDGNFCLFSTFYKAISCGRLMLGNWSPDTRAFIDVAPIDCTVDDILVACMQKSQPVYIGLPTDLIERKISSARSVQSVGYPLFVTSRPETHDYRTRVMATNIREIISVSRSVIPCQDFFLPPDTKMINSGAWLSIGDTLGACIGAAVAQSDASEDHPGCPKGRTILFEGDGSFQMTAQAVSDIICNRLDMTIFLINNDGYTMEPIINGMHAIRCFTRRTNNWGELFRTVESVAADCGPKRYGFGSLDSNGAGRCQRCVVGQELTALGPEVLNFSADLV